MRFWTIQPREIWDRMERGDAVRVDPDHPKYGGQRPWQYDWLAAALRRSRPGFDGGWPWWLSNEEPDVDRQRSKTLPGGRNQAIIELELPNDRCVTFPLWMWETIYTGQYLAAARQELDDWHRELGSAMADRETWPLPEPWRSRLEASWDRMFHADFRPRFWYRDEQIPEDDSSLSDLMRRASEGDAGLTQELRGSDALNVTLFTAAG